MITDGSFVQYVHVAIGLATVPERQIVGDERVRIRNLNYY